MSCLTPSACVGSLKEVPAVIGASAVTGADSVCSVAHGGGGTVMSV